MTAAKVLSFLLFTTVYQAPAFCRQQVAASIKDSYTSFGKWLGPTQLPIVYNNAYNVSFMGIENFHVFDSKKFGKVVASLEREQLLTRNQASLEVAHASTLAVALHACHTN